MNFTFPNINHLWSYLIVEELLRNGIDYFCLSPGSRSTPLTTALARNKKAQKIVIFDERAAAYHALGYARASGTAAVLVCTSGTAAANYFPAIIEASQENLPLIVLSADRPPELRDSGANQTVDQVKLYGTYVRWQMDLAAPDENIPASYVLSTVDLLARKAAGTNAGPTHLNCMFREPLAPQQATISKPYLQKIARWWHSPYPWTQHLPAQRRLNDHWLQKIARTLSASQKGLILLGRLPQNKNLSAVRNFIRQVDWPVFPDVSSGFRLGQSQPQLIPYFDLMAPNLSEPFDTVLHLGGRFVSKRLQQFLQRHPPQEYIHVCAAEMRLDEGQLVTQRLTLDPQTFCSALGAITSQESARQTTRLLHKKAQNIRQKLPNLLPENAPLTQPLLSRLLAREISGNSALFLANSLSVREMNSFADNTHSQVVVGVNRGASGIDGTLAAACGFAAGFRRPLTLLTGDLALLHDLNSLMLIKRIAQPLIIIVVNNKGGGIFHFLPIAGFNDVFEKYFATPHTLTFASAAHMFGLPYHSLTQGPEFVQLYRQAQADGSSMLIEIATNRAENHKLHQHLLEAISR